MSEEIFRQKSLDKIKSPESLHDYIHVTNPGIWILLVSIVVLLVGACVWGILGHVDSTVETMVTVENGQATCVVKEGIQVALMEGMSVSFGSFTGEIQSISLLENGDFSCLVHVDGTPVDGVYPAKIVIKTISPISFILN